MILAYAYVHNWEKVKNVNTAQTPQYKWERASQQKQVERKVRCKVRQIINLSH